MRRWLQERREDRERAAAIAEHEAMTREAIEHGEAHLGTVADVHGLLAAAAGLAEWEAVRAGRWTRPLAPEIRAVVELERMKGMSYRLAWGVSLAWLPHLTSTGTSLHRTAKSARLDLWEFGPRLRYEFAGDRIAWVPSEIEAIWQRCRPAAEALWAAADSPEGVLSTAERQAAEADLERRSRAAFPPPEPVLRRRVHRGAAGAS